MILQALWELLQIAALGYTVWQLRLLRTFSIASREDCRQEFMRIRARLTVLAEEKKR